MAEADRSADRQVDDLRIIIWSNQPVGKHTDLVLDESQIRYLTGTAATVEQPIDPTIIVSAAVVLLLLSIFLLTVIVSRPRQQNQDDPSSQRLSD